MIKMGKPMRPPNDEPGIIEQLGNRFQKQSPDFLEIKTQGVIPVFVYGTLRRGFHNHHYLKGLPFLGEANTTIERFEMRDAGQGSFPVVFERELKIKGKKRNPVVGKIKGEVYAVDPRTMLALDRLENNGGMYTRHLTWVFLSDQAATEKTQIRPSIKAWMYIGNEHYWQGRGAFESVPSHSYGGTKYYDWNDNFKTGVDEYEPNAYGYLAQ